MQKQNYTKIIVLMVIAVFAYIPIFIWMIERWSAHDTYYSHGFLVPFISLFIVWTKRKEFNELRIDPSNSGWIFIIPAVLIHVASSVFRISFTSGVSLIFVIMGLVLLSLGKDFLKRLLFPIFFLLFMVPLPMLAIANLSFRLKIFAAQVSTGIIKHLGIPAVREGSIIRTAHSQIMVEDPCSGIRSLIALIALGALMAYFSNISNKKKIVLFFSSIPIAVSGNIIRIVSLSMASEMYGDKLATGIFHDAMGILVFVFAFISLALVAKLLE